jgi:16S rRNA (guanine966-N2)-methyltransferase
MLRITGGHLRSRKIRQPILPGVRPSLEKNRQAVFNILGQDLQGLDFLDAFCGSGIMGFEALSRGARTATWIDLEKGCLDLIRNNCDAWDIPDEQRRCLQGRLPEDLKRMSLNPFHLVYLDPPFAARDTLPEEHLSARLASKLHEEKLLHEGAILVCESHPRVIPELSKSCFTSIKEKAHGNVHICFYRYG